jgi:hypothetical protein
MIPKMSVCRTAGGTSLGAAPYANNGTSVPVWSSWRFESFVAYFTPKTAPYGVRMRAKWPRLAAFGPIHHHSGTSSAALL